MLYRVYFNTHADFPLVWSIDTGDGTEELNVKTITVSGVLISNYRPSRQPKAWLSVIGKLSIADGHATIEKES
jgi:hypothetical protein